MLKRTKWEEKIKKKDYFKIKIKKKKPWISTWLSSLSLFKCFVCLCVCCAMALILNGPFMLWRRGAGGGLIFFNIYIHLPQPCKLICERTASPNLPSGLLSSLPSCCKARSRRRAFPSSLCREIIRIGWGEGKGSRVRLSEHDSYVSAHSVLPWFDPWPLTLTPLAWPPPDSRHSQVTQ